MAGITKRLSARKRAYDRSAYSIRKNLAKRTMKPLSKGTAKTTPRKPTTVLAARKVFAIPELLEAVLLHLSPNDLLRLQRVNSTFKAVIEQSNSIQQILFCKPRSDKKADVAMLNPFIRPILRRYGIYSRIDRYGQERRGTLRIPEDFRVRGTDHIEIEIRHDSSLPPPQTPFRETYKDMQLADSPLKIKLTFDFMNSYCYDEIESKTNMCELIEIVRRCEWRYEHID